MDGDSQQKASILKKIEIADIKDGLLAMKDGSVRGILMSNSVNFALKSTQEQDAITYRYQEFLNSLDFPLQILTVTRKTDVSDYLAMLDQRRDQQENELLKVQISEYTEFVKGLVQMVNIMSTFFYIVVPFTQAPEKQMAGLADKITGLFTSKNGKAQQRTYEEMKTGLWQRMEYISSGLSMMGIKTINLNNDELIELLYHMYNPDSREKPKLVSQLV